MTLRAGLLAMVALAFIATGTGCADKTAAERDSLLSQNEDLKKERDAALAAQQASDARADALTKQQAVAPPETMAPPSMDNSGSANNPPPAARGGRGTTPPRAAGGTGSTAVELSGGVTSSTNSRGEAQLEIAGDVLFDSGKATLKASAKKSLDIVATKLKSSYAGQQIRVEGHTDPTPVKSSGWDDNWDLGAARARSVLLYLESKGVKDMYIASFADTELKSTKNMALNRRVNIVVLKS